MPIMFLIFLTAVNAALCDPLLYLEFTNGFMVSISPRS
jgi:hypothetical protein